MESKLVANGDESLGFFGKGEKFENIKVRGCDGRRDGNFGIGLGFDVGDKRGKISTRVNRRLGCEKESHGYGEDW